MPIAAADLKPFLRGRYDRAAWIATLPELFGPERTKIFLTDAVTNLPVPESAQDRVAAMRQLGYVELGAATFFGAEHTVALVEVELKGGTTLIARNRVGLRALTYPYVDNVRAHAVLAFYYDPQLVDYRLSFQTRPSTLTSRTPDDAGTRRRYTFVLGPHEAATTAAARLGKLSQRAGGVRLTDVQEAFSVEKLSGEFFKQYKAFYEEFVRYLAGHRAYRQKFNLPEKPAPGAGLNTPEEKPLRDFVKRLLGRLVFLHFLQKKGWMGCPIATTDWSGGSPEFLLDLFAPFRSREDFHSVALTRLFFETLNQKRDNDRFDVPGLVAPCRIPYLNGGLFEEDQVDARGIDFPADKFERLLAFFAQYNFTIEENRPDDHDVGIDPEMLGHIFENLLEENRTKGAIYTPRPIVQYMCQESLIGYLTEHLQAEGVSRETVAAFVRDHDVQKPIQQRAIAVEKLLEKVRICDPAIGSGAFPIGLLQELFAARLYLYPYLSNEKRAVFDPAAIKKEIVARNIYGVDLDPGAVDIARLRFWLALVVDEAEPMALPNLDYKVMQGNSLLESFERVDLSKLTDPTGSDGDTLVLAEGIQFEIGAAFSKRRQPQIIFSGKSKADLLADITAYFEATADEKPTLRKRIKETVEGWLRGEMKRRRIRINDKLRAEEKHLTESLGPDFKQKLKPTSKVGLQYFGLLKELAEAQAKEESLLKAQEKAEHPYFLWHLYFKEVFDAGGFDIVIANPPYMRVQETQKYDVKPEYEHYYADITSGAYDLANLFVAQALDTLLSPRGVACLIFPHKFFNAEAGAGLRRKLQRGQHVHRLVHFGANPVFNGVDTYVCIAQLHRAPAKAIQLQRLPYPTPAEAYPALLADEAKYETVAYERLHATARLYSPDTAEAAPSLPPDERAAAEEAGAGTFPWMLFETAAEYELLETLYAADMGREKAPDADDDFFADDAPPPDRYTLADAVDIFVGLQTSHDDLYVLEVSGQTATHWIGHSKVSAADPDRIKPWEVEKALWKPWLRGRDVHRYDPLPDPPDRVVLFPYTVEWVPIKKGSPELEEKAVPVPPATLKAEYAGTYGYVDYFQDKFPGHKPRTRKGADADAWYRYQYPKSLLEQAQEVPRLASMEICVSHPNLTFNDGRYFHTSKVYGWIKRPTCAWSYDFLLTVANSRLLWWFLKRTGDTLQGDARTLKTSYLNPFPLPRRVPTRYQDALAAMGRMLRWLHGEKRPAVVPTLQNRTVAQYFQQVLDLGVCELYLSAHMREKQVAVLDELVAFFKQEVPTDDASHYIADAFINSLAFRAWQAPESQIRYAVETAWLASPEWLRPIFSFENFGGRDPEKEKDKQPSYEKADPASLAKF